MTEAAQPQPEPVPEPTPKEQELLAALQRAQADFANFRARIEREKAQWREDLQGEAVSPLLPAFDNLWRALDAAKGGGTLEALVQGVTQVRAQVEKSLAQMGIRRIEAEGQAVDPKFHEVVAQVPAPEGTPPGQVVHVVEQGYTLGGRLLRPARVTASG